MPSSILNSDDGVISGTSGLKSSGGDDGNLVFQSKGTETARINTDKQIVAAAGTASLPALTTTGDLNTGIFFPAADTIAFAEGGAEAMRIDSSGNVGIGTTSPASRLHVLTGANTGITFQNTGGAGIKMYTDSTPSNADFIVNYYGGSPNQTGTAYIIQQNGTERARITSGGQLLVGTTSYDLAIAGSGFGADGLAYHTRSGNLCLEINRLADDGTLVQFRQAGTAEGTISVSGSTVSYNGGHLSRWAQMLTKPDLLKGTVMSNLDEMNVYVKPTLYWTEEDELPEGVNVGDLKQETSVSDNEQLNKVKVSDVEGDANVAGVFVNWTYDEAHQVDEINMAMTGDMIIRIAQGTTVARGDLLMSAGDGTAKPQGDDIVRSKTIAKVTSTHVTCTYDDGSYCVPCVLMAC
jgi:hypothetical protein